MRFWRLVLFPFLGGALVAAPVSAFEMAPGEWEVLANINGISRLNQRYCLTAEDTKKIFDPDEIASKDCEVKVLANEDALYSYEKTCTGRDKMELKAESKKIDDREILDTVSMTLTDSQGRQQIVQMTISKKFISTTCSSTSIPARK